MRYEIPKMVFINEVKFYLTLDVQHYGIKERSKIADKRHNIARIFFTDYFKSKSDIIIDNNNPTDDERCILHYFNQKRNRTDASDAFDFSAIIRAIQLTLLSLKKQKLYARDSLFISSLREKTGFLVKEIKSSHIQIDTPTPCESLSKNKQRNFAKDIEIALNNKYGIGNYHDDFTVHASFHPTATLHIVLSRAAEDNIDTSNNIKSFSEDILDPVTLVETDKILHQHSTHLSKTYSINTMHALTGIPRYRKFLPAQEFGQWHFSQNTEQPFTPFVYTDLRYISDRTLHEIRNLMHDESYLHNNQLRINLSEITPLKERLTFFENDKQQLQQLFHREITQQPYTLL